jgi:hypothetical protein
MNDIIQLKITLQRTHPPIWRRLLVDKNTTFAGLHHIIQIAMGWENCHLFEFKTLGYRIGEPTDDMDDFFGSGKLIDASTITLAAVITGTKEKMEYEYDFGDGWIHQVVVEKFLPRDSKSKYPVCTGGQLNCPPEDCGGVDGFYHLLDSIRNKKHPEHKNMLEWLGGPFDTDYFEPEEINQYLRKIDSHLKKWTLDE